MNFFNFIEQMGGGTQPVPENQPPESREEKLKRLIQQRQQRQSNDNTSEKLKQLLQSRETNKDTKLKLKDYLQKQEKNAQPSAAQQPMDGEKAVKPNNFNEVPAHFGKDYVTYLLRLEDKNASNEKASKEFLRLSTYIDNVSKRNSELNSRLMQGDKTLGFPPPLIKSGLLRPNPYLYSLWIGNYHGTKSYADVGAYMVDRYRIINNLLGENAYGDIYSYLRKNPEVIDKIIAMVEAQRKEIKNYPVKLHPAVMHEYDKIEDQKTQELILLKKYLFYD